MRVRVDYAMVPVDGPDGRQVARIWTAILQKKAWSSVRVIRLSRPWGHDITSADRLVTNNGIVEMRTGATPDIGRFAVHVDQWQFSQKG